MKKILITRRLLRSCEDKAGKIFDVKFNSNDELHSQEKLIKLSEGCDGILSALTDKLDATTINKLPKSIKILSNTEILLTSEAENEGNPFLLKITFEKPLVKM